MQWKKMLTGLVGVCTIGSLGIHESPSSAQTMATPQAAGLSALTTLVPMTPANADRIRQLAQWGRTGVEQIAWSPNGKTFAVSDAVGTFIYDAIDTPPRPLKGNIKCFDLAFTSDGMLIGCGTVDTKVSLWKPDTGELRREIKGRTK
jgi:WD40 repeat protein